MAWLSWEGYRWKWRVPDFLPKEEDKDNIGVYKLTFFVEPYFQSQQLDTFYPYIEVVFEIKDDKHYHVPITLSAYGYGTYRGNWMSFFSCYYRT